MKFSLKTKLRLGLIFIFGLTLIIAVSSHFYLQNIVRQTKDIAKSNYETLDFVEQMRDALDFDGATDTADWQRYEQYLIKQEHNVTETGEAEATDILRGASETYKQTKSDTSHRQIATQLTKINALNRAAILRKNAASIQSTEDAAFGLAILSAVCILVAFSFLFNFPDYIANPVVRLKEGILKIASW